MKKKQGMMEKISVCVAGSAWAFRTIFLKAPHTSIAKSCAAGVFILKLPDP